MEYDNGSWIMRGLGRDDPRRIKDPAQLLEYINSVGFLPLFRGRAAGFSLEELTYPPDWWSDDPAHDPWLWRQIIAAGGKAAYGKFFDGKAGFVSLEWLPRLCNSRRDGYDFDALWEDEKASLRCKKIMDCFEDGRELFSYELKQLAGFGKGGEKNYEGTVTLLQMKTYLCIRDFRCRRNKAGEPYGWPIAVLTTPEARWGQELVTRAYSEAPETSLRIITEHLAKTFPQADEAELLRTVR